MCSTHSQKCINISECVAFNFKVRGYIQAAYFIKHGRGTDVLCCLPCLFLLLQSDDWAYAYQVFDDRLFFEEFRYDDSGVCLKAGERNLLVCFAGDGFPGGFQGDYIIGVRQRGVTRFFHMVDGEGEHPVFDFCFQKGTVTYPSTSAANSGV